MGFKIPPCSSCILNPQSVELHRRREVLMQTREEIVAGLSERIGEVVSWFTARADNTFGTGPEGRWTEGQTLDHLVRSVKPLNLALRLPKVALKMQFGTAKGPSETLEKLTARHEGLLAAGGKASGQFVRAEVSVEEKPKLVEELRSQGKKLTDVVQKWSEDDLDKYVLPHPLLGKLSVRDMLLFTYHHNGHHLDILKRDY